MASLNQLKQQIDCHDLAGKLGLERPHGRGNYRSPHHDDKAPSLSIFKDGKAWKDHSSDDGGTCVDLVMYVEDMDLSGAVKRLHEIYGFPMDKGRAASGPPVRDTREDYIAKKCLVDVAPAIDYLAGRNISETAINRSIKARTVGFNTWESPKIPAGEPGHGGPAAAFIVQTLNPGHVMAVDMRYLDPELNGGVKTQCQGEKLGYPWFSDRTRLQAAQSVYIVESPINALSIDTCGMGYTTAIATRGVNGIDAIDWGFLTGKRAVICMDNDDPDRKGRCPGQEAAWQIYELLTARNIAAHMVDQSEWEKNDVNDMLGELGPTTLAGVLKKLDPYVIPGVDGKGKGKGRRRVYLPIHDFQQYWRFRAKEDFVTHIKRVIKDEGEGGGERKEYQDVCGFRVASITRITVASAQSAITGDIDHQPRTLFAVAIQTPRHKNKLERRVFEDERLFNIEQWKKLGPIFSPAAFLRMINIMERAAHLGERNAVNFVGLTWRDGKTIVNQGEDCYFSDPDQQCPYHNLSFPSGHRSTAAPVLKAYQRTFGNNAAALALVWGLGAHLKAFLGFWPHMIMQADKGAGKSTLIKHLERTIAMTMFSGESINTAFRILTSLAHTSHPIGWEEISARKQDIIDKAVSQLQESYQYTTTRRGSEMTEFLICASVLLTGEDVPVKSLLGKTVRTELKVKGPQIPDELPQFPVLEFLRFLATLDKAMVRDMARDGEAYCREHCSADSKDAGGDRMVTNYGALLAAWRLICEFAGMDESSGNFIHDLLAEMNRNILDTEADREPWVWIMETLLHEVEAGTFRGGYALQDVDTDDGQKTCICIRPSSVIHHLSSEMRLRDKWNMLPVKSARVFKRQMTAAGVVVRDDVHATIRHRRLFHLVAISVDALAEYGLHVDIPDQAELGFDDDFKLGAPDRC